MLAVSLCVWLYLVFFPWLLQLAAMLDYLVQVSSSQGEGQAKGITASARVAAEKVRRVRAVRGWLCVAVRVRGGA